MRSFIGVFLQAALRDPKVGGAIVIRDVKFSKRPYNAPSFEVVDISAAKTELETNAAPENIDARRMLALIDTRLKEKKSTSNSASPNLMP